MAGAITVATSTSGMKLYLPVLICLDSEHERYREVYCCIKTHPNMQTMKSWQPWSCSKEENADYVKMPIMAICTDILLRIMEMLTHTQGCLHAAGTGHENVVLEKASKQRLTHGF